ncbi:MAG: PH domain-containing protein [Coriobacteriia bacterium]|nr:PH domain-containing protein [Coriobacteriia bacterium]
MRQVPQYKLDPKIQKVWRISGLIKLVFALAILLPLSFLIAHLSSIPLWMLLLVVCAIAILIFIIEIVLYPRIAFDRWRYEVNENEIDIMHGFIWIKRTVIPLVRVQNVETSQGPILRAYTLSEVVISTAGGSSKIPGLTPEDADKLRDRVAVLARIAQEDV